MVPQMLYVVPLSTRFFAIGNHLLHRLMVSRLDVEVEKAFKKGFAEERQKHIEEMKALNAAIEVKEGRITELLVAMAAMEKKVRFVTQGCDDYLGPGPSSIIFVTNTHLPSVLR